MSVSVFIIYYHDMLHVNVETGVSVCCSREAMSPRVVTMSSDSDKEEEEEEEEECSSPYTVTAGCLEEEEEEEEIGLLPWLHVKRFSVFMS